MENYGDRKRRGIPKLLYLDTETDSAAQQRDEPIVLHGGHSMIEKQENGEDSKSSIVEMITGNLI